LPLEELADSDYLNVSAGGSGDLTTSSTTGALDFFYCHKDTDVAAFGMESCQIVSGPFEDDPGCCVEFLCPDRC
jgi:hypothetical protein